MKIYMDPKEYIIINLEEVKQVTKYGATGISIEFKDGCLKAFDLLTEYERDQEFRVIYHEMTR